MKTIEYTSQFGKFAYSISCEIGDEVNAETTALAVEGMASTAFRALGSECEKALVKAGFMKADQKRADVPYSAQAHEVLQTSADAKLTAVCKKKGFPAMLLEFTGEYVPKEAGPSKEATSKWEEVKAIGNQEKAKVHLGVKPDATDAECIAAVQKLMNAAAAEAKRVAGAGLGI